MSTARKGEKMKKILVILALLTTILVGCSNQKSGETQEIIDYLIEKCQKDDTKEGYDVNYTEDDFSFKIYYDKDKDKYLIQAYEPYESESNKLKWEYEWLDNEAKLIKYKSVFEERLDDGDYEVIYQSGKFAE